MGNLQGSESRPLNKLGKSPGRRKSGNKLFGKNRKEEIFNSIVPDENEATITSNSDDLTVPETSSTTFPLCQVEPVSESKYLVTDSWKHVNKLSSKEGEVSKSQVTPPSGESSSDSVFTDPLTPVGFAAEINHCYYSEESVDIEVEVPDVPTENWALNSFKLNEYKQRREQELSRKISKLGVSKTSQISLEDNAAGCFVSGDVVVVDKNIMNNMGNCNNTDATGDKINTRRSSFYRPRKIELVATRIAPDNALLQSGPEYKRHISMVETETVVPENNVLRKVASLQTLEKNVSEGQLNIVKPKFVPEKLDFKIYEKFEGHMLVNWYLSEFGEDHYIKTKLSVQELKLLAAQFCTHLLAAGVLCQIPDKDVPLESVFRMDLMYYWAHMEVSTSVPQTPGKLSTLSWPPTSPANSEVFVSPCSNNEFPRTPMSDIGKLNGNINKVKEIEELVEKLRSELEKYKTLADIQALTSDAVKDFESPVKEKPKVEEQFICSRCKSKINDVNSDEINSQVETVPVKSEISDKNPQTTHGLVLDDGPKSLTNNIEKKSPIKTVESDVQISDKNVVINNSEKSSVLMEECSKKVDEVEVSSPRSKLTPLVIGVNPLPPPPPPMPPLEEVTSVSSSTTTPIVGPPPPPPMPGMGPPPPPMPGTGPPPPPMPGMGPPPPPMPGMGPPPPPMPGMGLPPPPLPGIGPPPPPMPGVVSSKAPGAPPLPSPGSLGPIPLPTPPIGGWNPQKATLRKLPVSPSVPMKPLYWTRIVIPTIEPVAETVNSQEKPLWLSLEETQIDNLGEFTDLFSRQVIARKPTKKKTEENTKIQAAKILESKRSQNVGILAQSLHVEFSEIENAIYNFDTSIVSLEALQQIYEARANAEELSQIKSHVQSKPEVPLDKPEQFLFDLSEISSFAYRISCFMFQTEFEDCISTIDGTLTNLKSTCEFLINSESLKKVLALILTLGNYMNGGNMQRGQADGFGLEILAKLKDVKSKDNQVTLLHFIIRTFMKQLEDPLASDLALPIPEPGDIDRAATVNFEDVQKDLQQIQKRLNDCTKETEKVIEESNEENVQPFKDKMTKFLEAAEKQLTGELENLEECKTKFINTMKFYHFKPKSGTLDTFPPNEFFILWSQFCVDFKDIWKKEQQRLYKEKLKELKRKQEERMSKVQKMKKREGGLKSKIEKLRASKNL